jgi:ATP-dependent DNA helicase RecG
MSILINIVDLLSGQVVENSRIEFKTSWNPTSILRTICAFANDFENEGSGYIVIGVEENNGFPIRPVKGYDLANYDKDTRDLYNYCRQIQPSFVPRLSLEEIDGKNVLVIWCPAGANRPYKVPDDVNSRHRNFNYRIRFESSSIVPNEEQTAELIQLTAKIPFDDRVNTFASITDLNKSLMQQHLLETNSKLYFESEEMSIKELAEKMNLCQGADEHLFPKNVGLLMFSKRTQEFFKGAIIELIEFPNGLTEDFTEMIFSGSIQKQLVDVLEYFRTHILKTKVIKHSSKEKADRFQNYPYNAIEEAIANAVYHRNYELQDPIEIRVLPNGIEIISFSGVDPSLKQIDFERGMVRARRYRNRRVGEFLKELKLTEGRGTGIPTIINSMLKNGSPVPFFDTNEPNRTYFITEIPIHKAFLSTNFDQDTDQEEVGVNDLIIKEIDRIDSYIENTSSQQIDQDADQDADQDKKEKVSSNFTISSSVLIQHLKRLANNEVKMNERIYNKYRDSALALSLEQEKVLRMAFKPISNKELQEKALGLKAHHDNFKNYIEPLLIKGFLDRTVKDKPTSKFQKYFITSKGRRLITILTIINE